MIYIYAIILGIVQGLTEFLPVSSSGHLVLLNSFFGYGGDFLFLSILLHVATLIAVLIVLRKEVFYIIKNPLSKTSLLLVVATIPTVILVLIFKKFIESSFTSINLLPYFFALTGILLAITDILSKKVRPDKEFSFKSALLMGVAQGFAVVPGISRSGATICTGMLMGEKKEETAKFSFLMSIPIILASMLFEILSIVKSGSSISFDIIPTLLAFIFAFISGIIAIKFMLKLVEKTRLFFFSIYLFALAIILIIVGV